MHKFVLARIKEKTHKENEVDENYKKKKIHKVHEIEMVKYDNKLRTNYMK